MDNTVKIDYKNIFYPPGGILMWIIIYLELVTFGIALVFMALNARAEPEVFHESRLLLNTGFGAINTVFLLSSGWCMAQSVHFLKAGNFSKSKLFLMFTVFGGFLFLALKSFEYYEKVEAGLTVGYNSFFGYYWMLTLFHVIHVIVGIVILAVLGRTLSKKPETLKVEDYESGAAFWHMCDLIWLLLFPIIYLLF
ncbi:cytochrome c oxidase subunit 3 [Aequorivita lipolytica]|uniref:Nitric oxide reductase n=1 Tax=Aequorivita lipolytica TaxID=153267 RepID=A0A5C6YRJ2_9FLAO|nr:cytochrome c oxidase subunit 3 [Aequorivita lipolytica]TXD69546.1 nitric oxide reductase [Aequorivita lipolytica]SRX51027.1 Cytochrome c oxidase subunit 3 [Aequorivita lipolytica]